MATRQGAAHAVDAFSEAVARTRSPRAERVLRRLAAVYALGITSRDAAWYLAQGALTPSQVKRIPRLMETLCAQLLADAEFLTDGFALSDDLLRAPALSPDLSAFRAQEEGSPR
ncbi:acyl-CoA dehydrogenase [Streptomyces sp. NPDC001514]